VQTYVYFFCEIGIVLKAVALSVVNSMTGRKFKNSIAGTGNCLYCKFLRIWYLVVKHG